MGIKEFFGVSDSDDLSEYNKAKDKVKEYEEIEKLAKKLRDSDKEVIDFSLIKAKRIINERKRPKMDDDEDEEDLD